MSSEAPQRLATVALAWRAAGVWGLLLKRARGMSAAREGGQPVGR